MAPRDVTGALFFCEGEAARSRVQRYRIAPVREGPPALHAAITLTPRGGMPAVILRGAPRGTGLASGGGHGVGWSSLVQPTQELGGVMKIFATRVWGFDPWNWPVVVFGREGDLNSLLARSSPGDRIVFAATLDQERVEPQNRGRLLGMAEFGRQIVRTEKLVQREHMSPHDLDETGRVRWPYALPMTKAWRFPDIPGTVDTLGHQLPYNATSQAVLLDDDETRAIGRLRIESVELPPVVEPYRAVVDALPRGKPTTGPTPTSASFSVERVAEQRAFTYCLQFGKRELWKIGHTVDPKQRLCEVNTHVPSEVLGERWQIVLTHPWDSSSDAQAMEQRVLKALERFRTEGERVLCSRKELDRGWQAGAFSKALP